MRGALSAALGGEAGHERWVALATFSSSLLLSSCLRISARSWGWWPCSLCLRWLRGQRGLGRLGRVRGLHGLRRQCVLLRGLWGRLFLPGLGVLLRLCCCLGGCPQQWARVGGGRGVGHGRGHVEDGVALVLEGSPGAAHRGGWGTKTLKEHLGKAA